MQKQQRFCTSADGTQLAFTVYGSAPGTPAIQATAWTGNQDLFEAVPEMGRNYDLLGDDRTFVTTDPRGVGGSQRDVAEISLELLVADLTAVIDELGSPQVDLVGFIDGCATAAAYAVLHSERVSHLVLHVPSTHGEVVGRPDEARSVIDLIKSNWPLAQRTLADLIWGGATLKQRMAMARNIERTVSPDVAAMYVRHATTFDIRAILPQVQSPTLVVDMPGPGRVTRGVRAVAALIPNARLVKQETGMMDDNEGFVAYLTEFLDEGREGESSTTDVAAADTHTILFTDMESSTALGQRLGDAKAQEVRHAHNEIVRAALSANGGSEIKHTGDGIMASFSTASSALECAIAIQRGVAAHKEEHPDTPLGVYVGLNAGEPIAEEEDLFGTSVDLAARLVDHAQPGQIIASDVVRQLAAGKNFLFADLGETALRGFEDPVRLYDVRWREEG